MAHETTDQLLAELSDYWDKDHDGNLYKLFENFNKPMQEISVNLKKMNHWQALKNAKGTTLDMFGKDIKTYRTSDNDDDYRFMIHLNELLSKVQGTIPSINHIVTAALQADDGDVEVYKKDMPRHFGLDVPLKDIRSPRIEHFLVDNRQNLAALGYWLDEIRMSQWFQFHLFYGTYGGSTDSYFNSADKNHIVHADMPAGRRDFYYGANGGSSDSYYSSADKNHVVQVKQNIDANYNVGNYATSFAVYYVGVAKVPEISGTQSVDLNANVGAVTQREIRKEV